MLSLQSYAEEGRVFPDSAQVNFAWQVNSDTVTVMIENLSSQPIEHFFLSDFTDSAAVLINCLVDGIDSDPLEADSEYGSVYPGQYTTRWVVDVFSQSLSIKYYSPSYSGNKLSWSAGHPFAIFGILTAIPPPQNVIWQQ